LHVLDKFPGLPLLVVAATTTTTTAAGSNARVGAACSRLAHFGRHGIACGAEDNTSGLVVGFEFHDLRSGRGAVQTLQSSHS
jgi:hypothetical protein